MSTLNPDYSLEPCAAHTSLRSSPTKVLKLGIRCGKPGVYVVVYYKVYVVLYYKIYHNVYVVVYVVVYCKVYVVVYHNVYVIKPTFFPFPFNYQSI